MARDSRSARACFIAGSGSGGALASDADDLLHRPQLPGQDLLAGGGDLIRAAALAGGQRPDPAAALQPGQRAVQGARLHADAAESGDVGHDRVAVLGAVGQAGQDQQRRVGEPAEAIELTVHPAPRLLITAYYTVVNSAPSRALSIRQPALSPRRATAHRPGHGPGTKPSVKAARAPPQLRSGLQPSPSLSAGIWPAGRAA